MRLLNAYFLYQQNNLVTLLALTKILDLIEIKRCLFGVL